MGCGGWLGRANWGGLVVGGFVMLDVAGVDPRYAVLARREAAGWFYGVVSTGIFCRARCGARLPRPENVRFFESAADAAKAGYRACKRCRPEVALPDVAAAACRRIEAAEVPPSLAELAAGAGLSPFHFHRVFKAATGVTPKAYAGAHRAARVREALDSGNVTQAIYAAGYASSGRFYAEAPLGMTPAAYQAGGAGEEIVYATASCALGVVLVAASGAGVCAIALGDDAAALEAGLKARFGQARLADDAGFGEILAQVVALVDGAGTAKNLPLDIRGTAFQRRVWEALRGIPAGQTANYTEIAARIGAPASVRAVAAACAANTLAVAVPCHRVVRADGGLAGYRWGVSRKRALLEREALT